MSGRGGRRQPLGATAVRAAALGLGLLTAAGCVPGSDSGASGDTPAGSGPTASAQASELSGDAGGTPPATAPSGTPRPAGWQLVLEEAQPGRVTHVTGVATDGALAVAVGVVVNTPVIHVGPYEREPRIWLTSDGGITWESIPAADLGNTHLTHVVATDRGFFAFGWAEPTASDPGRLTSIWHSADGRRWEPATFDPVSDEAWTLTDVAVGPRGWVMIGSVFTQGPPEQQIWHSGDGRDWELVRAAPMQIPVSGEETYRAVAAGPEGFVVIGNHAIEGGGPPVILASGDGRTWEVAPEQEAFVDQDLPLGVAALGGDWVIAGGRAEGGAYTTYVPVWWSADGLEWEMTAQLTDPLTRPEFGLGTSLASTGDRVYLSASLGGFVEQQEAGVYSSTDARTWTPLEIDPAAAVVEAIASEDVFVLVGHIATRESRAAIWAGRPD